MLHIFEPAANSNHADRIQRSPAVPVALAFAAGILIDRWIDWRFEIWWIVTLTSLLLACICRRLRLMYGVSLFLLVACAGLAGTWHHWQWSCLAGNDISAWATEFAQPVLIHAKVLQAPRIRSTNNGDQLPWQLPDRTYTVVACQSINDAHGDFVPVAGQARLTIVGRLPELAVGDRIRIVGTLTRPPEPSNPGEFDSRLWMRAQGLRVNLIAEFPDAVRILGRERNWLDRFLSLRAAVRTRAEELISSHLRPRTAPVAQSLLLGSRVDIDRDLRRAFAESGTLHVLAISGMNVGLLWMWLWRVFRTLRCSPHFSLTAVLMVLPAYAFITDANPPVVRATITAMVMALGQLGGRKDSRWNSLALAALLVLAWNPTDLFNSGAQLSFVAVFAILLINRFLRSVRVSVDRDDGPIGGSMLGRFVGSAIRFVVETYLIGVGIWVMTSPLIASQFHLVSPIGVLLNIVLGPLIAVVFWLGYSFLLLGLLFPVLFGWLGVPFDISLGWFLSAVEMAAAIDLGHGYVPTPATWWIAGFYILLLSLIVVDHMKGRLYWSARAILVWSVFGLTISLMSDREAKLTCTVLSVGHGLSILVECPNGRTLLYDAGGMSGGSRIAQTIESALWMSGRGRIDAAVVSHADADHCNALPELFKVVRSQALFVHRTFLDWKQPPVAEALECSAAAGVPIRLIADGQSIKLDPLVAIRVLHPAPDFRGSSDNANSVVLCVEYAGRRILLMGDLERDGLIQLLRSKPVNTDVLLAPHHGSLAANPPDLARWATPEWLIVSCRDDSVSRRLATNFGDSTEILTTAKFGAIQCRIASDGNIRFETFKQPRR